MIGKLALSNQRVISKRVQGRVMPSNAVMIILGEPIKMSVEIPHSDIKECARD
jgi:hypothetical protein